MDACHEQNLHEARRIIARRRFFLPTWSTIERADAAGLIRRVSGPIGFSPLRRKLSRGITRSSARSAFHRRAQSTIMPTAIPSASDPTIDTRIFWDRHKMEVIAALVVALLAIAGVAGYRFYTYRHEADAAQALATAKAGPDFQKVIAKFPGTSASGTAALLLAEEQRGAGKFADANTTLQVFIEKNPKHELAGTARMAMAANLESLGKPDEALTVYQRLPADDPHGFTAPLALLAQVHLLKQKHQIEEARRVCETIINQHQDSMVAGEASRQLRSLKPATPPAAPAPSPTAPM